MDWLLSRRLKRLRTAVDVRGISTLAPGVDPEDPEAQRVQQHLDLAKRAAEKGRINDGWGHLHEAERIAVGLLDTDGLNAIVVDLRREAMDSKKFKTWRRNAIVDHLGGEDGAGEVRARDVQHALLLRSEHFDNIYGKIDETLFWVGFASWAVVAFLVVLVAGAATGWIPLGEGSAALMVTAVLMGALGGALSTGLSLAQTSTKASIPDLLREGSVTAFRPVLGGAMAAVTLVFIEAGLLDFLIGDDPPDPWLVAAFGFLAGYSERWFIGIVGRVSERKAEAEDQPK